MKTEYVKILKAALICLIIGTLAFIFSQSTLPPEVSKAESDAVGEIIEEIIPPETPPGEYVQKNLRKIGHFVEFLILGTEVAVFVIFFARKIRYGILSVIFSPLVALCDETIQIFSDRGPSITDVWIDTAGFASASAIAYLIYLAVIFTKKKLALRKRKNDG